MNEIQTHSNNLSSWERCSPLSKRDLIIKKIALTLIGIINFTILGMIFYSVVSYCTIPTKAIISSTFIVGVIGALIYLGFKTFGLSTMNYTQLSTPAALAGRVLTYLFFGPLMQAVKYCDWTAYHNPFVANRLAHELSDTSPPAFEKLAKKYGEHFDNFAKYGIIPLERKESLIALYQDFKPVQKELEYYEKKGLSWHQRVRVLTQEKASFEKRWLELRGQISAHLPYPPLPQYDFSSRLTDLRLYLMDFFEGSLRQQLTTSH